MLSPPSTSKNEMAKPDSHHARGTPRCALSSEVIGRRAALTHRHGSFMVHKMTMYLGNLTGQSQGTQGVLHRDNSSPKSSWEAVGSVDAPSWKCTGIQQGRYILGSLRELKHP